MKVGGSLHADQDWADLSWRERVEAMAVIDAVSVPWLDDGCDFYNGPGGDGREGPCEAAAGYVIVVDAPNHDWGPRSYKVCPGDRKDWTRHSDTEARPPQTWPPGVAEQ